MKNEHNEITDAIKTLMRKIEDFKRTWENAWVDREQKITRKIETVQILSEQNQVSFFVRIYPYCFIFQ